MNDPAKCAIEKVLGEGLSSLSLAEGDFAGANESKRLQLDSDLQQFVF